jgi:hypothetical protein
VHSQTVQDTEQGDAATPLETGARQRTDAERQRAAEVKRKDFVNSLDFFWLQIFVCIFSILFLHSY